MEAMSGRRFTLLDASALVAASGFGFVSARPFLADLIATSRTIETVSLDEPYYWRAVLLERPSSFLSPSVLNLTSGSVFAVLRGHRSPLWATSVRGQVAAIAQDVSALAFPILCSWSITILILRLVRPRPPRRSLARQPGLWACGSAVGGILAASWLETALGGAFPPIAIPIGVGLAWLGLAIGRRWTGERTWLDRLGRVIGMFWLALALPLSVWYVSYWRA